MAEAGKNYVPGITFRSLCASLFGLLVMGMYVQYSEVIQGATSVIAEQALPPPALTVLVLLLALSGLTQLLVRKRLLSKAEQLCVVFTLLIACPMMTQGMWHRFVGLISATPREGNFQYIDALSDRLWPHGPNLVPGALTEAQKDGLTSAGNAHAWEEIEYEAGETALLPVLRNTKDDEVSSVTFRVPVVQEGQPGVEPGAPHLLSFLARGRELGTKSYVFARVAYDESDAFQEVVNTQKVEEKTFLHQTGFVRLGQYGVTAPPEARESVRITLGLSGPGTVALYDAKFFSVAALVSAYTGRKEVLASEYETLPLSERAGLLVRPDSMWSLAGLKYLLCGYIPVREWMPTLVTWGVFIGLLLAGLLAVGVIMRKQWAESERYPFPLFQIPNALNGDAEDSDDNRAFSPVWHSRLMWTGFAFALAWGLLKGWAFYNPKVPNTEVNLSLFSYISDPGWGDMWKVSFIVSAFLVSIAIFFELNVLFSLVLGFFMFRALYWVGETSGLKVYAGYPFKYEQAVGAYVAYALLVVFFARKYLWKVLEAAAKGRREVWAGEAMSYPVALGVLALAFVGVGAWAAWLGVSVGAILAYFLFLMSIGLVAAKFRSECGLPNGYFTPYNAMLFVSLLGGMKVFGANGMMVCLIASGFLTVSVFFFIPGAQVELLEFGKRHRIVPRHLVYTVVIGLLGGVFIGGWVFLSNAYALGGDNIRYCSDWAMGQGWFFRSYATELTATNAQVFQPDSAAVAGGWRPVHFAYLYGAGGATLFTVLRQIFAGFWFHPIGFILGSAHMLESSWGSCLVAGVIRWVVLKFGGAATVKTKLFPFFIGVFLGCCASILLFTLYGYHLQANGIERIYGVLP